MLVVLRNTSEVEEDSERLRIGEALEEYCKMDTWAEVEIVKGRPGVV